MRANDCARTRKSGYGKILTTDFTDDSDTANHNLSNPCPSVLSVLKISAPFVAAQSNP